MDAFTKVEGKIAKQVLDQLAPFGKRMTEWESKFCYDITHVVEKGGSISKRQYAVLKSTLSKYISTGV